jgi:hypothetical protein
VNTAAVADAGIVTVNAECADCAAELFVEMSSPKPAAPPPPAPAETAVDPETAGHTHNVVASLVDTIAENDTKTSRLAVGCGFVMLAEHVVVGNAANAVAVTVLVPLPVAVTGDGNAKSVASALAPARIVTLAS